MALLWLRVPARARLPRAAVCCGAAVARARRFNFKFKRRPLRLEQAVTRKDGLRAVYGRGTGVSCIGRQRTAA